MDLGRNDRPGLEDQSNDGMMEGNGESRHSEVGCSCRPMAMAMVPRMLHSLHPQGSWHLSGFASVSVPALFCRIGCPAVLLSCCLAVLFCCCN